MSKFEQLCNEAMSSIMTKEDLAISAKSDIADKFGEYISIYPEELSVIYDAFLEYRVKGDDFGAFEDAIEVYLPKGGEGFNSDNKLEEIVYSIFRKIRFYRNRALGLISWPETVSELVDEVRIERERKASARDAEDIKNVTDDNWKEFEQRVAGFDKNYARSDDHRVWSKGSADNTYINNMSKLLNKVDPERVNDILTRHGII